MWQEQPFGIRNSSSTPISEGRYRKKVDAKKVAVAVVDSQADLFWSSLSLRCTQRKKTPDEDERVLVPGAWAPPVLYDDAEAKFP